jgi:metal-responsive CopG/Arc/MetJ family transcriptional regulator
MARPVNGPRVLREFLEGLDKVCKTGLRVRTCATANAIRDILEEFTAGVEDDPLAVGVVEVALVMIQRQLEVFGTEIPVDQREVAGGIGDGCV